MVVVLFVLPIEKWATKPADPDGTTALPKTLGNRVVIGSSLADSRNSQQA